MPPSIGQAAIYFAVGQKRLFLNGLVAEMGERPDWFRFSRCSMADCG
jgi:hypothetical protein